VNLHRFDLNLLTVFDAILRTRSVTVAASQVGLTQSATSNALNRLRQIFDDQLFVRIGSGMAPTPRAEQLAEPIRDALARIRSTLDLQQSFDPATSDRTFRLFMTDVGQMVLLPKVIQALAAEAPNVNVQTVQVPPFRLREEAMESGEVDLAVGYFAEFEGPFHRQRLFTERYVCMVRAGHPQVQGKLTLEQFLAVPHVVYWPAGGGHGQQEAAVERSFEESGATRRVSVRVTHFLGLTSIVSSTDNLLTTPSRLAEALGRLAEVQILEPPIEIPTFDVTQHWHVRFHQDPGNRWLRQLFMRLHGD
jgi:DNA-binding transcriptional LysR family regulator